MSSNNADDLDPIDLPKPDVILRSSDNLQFPTYSLLLSLSSPVFRTMFTLPQPVDSSPPDVPIVNVAEDGVILARLLAFCDPGKAPLLHDLPDIQATLVVATKYEMAGIVQRLETLLETSDAVKEEPVRVFAIAHCNGLDRLARMAAQYTLRFPISNRPYVPELELINATTLFRLQDFFFKCQKATRAIASQYSWITRDSFVWFRCNSNITCERHYEDVTISGGSMVVSARKWWTDFMREVREALGRRPCVATITDIDITNKALKRASMCHFCRERVFVEMKEFTDIYAAEISRVISEVRAYRLTNTTPTPTLMQLADTGEHGILGKTLSRSFLVPWS
jgi:hypothetical protein